MDLSRIRTLCSEKGIEQKYLAKEIGISEQALIQLMNRNSCRITTLNKIADFFNVPISYFSDEVIVKKATTKKEGEIRDRLRKLMHHAEMNQIAFAERIGIEYSRINKILNTELDFGVEVIQGVARAFPEINLTWLLLGTGEMIAVNNIAAEPKAQYNKTCKNCEYLTNTNNNLNKLIRSIEMELEDCKKRLPEEKRKVS